MVLILFVEVHRSAATSKEIKLLHTPVATDLHVPTSGQSQTLHLFLDAATQHLVVTS